VGANGVALPPPGVALRWTLHLPSVGGRPWTRQHLEVKLDGTALWESDTGGGDGDLTEALTEKPNASRKVVRCLKRLDPTVQRKLVEAARRSMSAGCSQEATAIDAASTTIALAWQGESMACNVARSGGGYVAFEKARTEAVTLICQR